jgi:hypothetical protein
MPSRRSAALVQSRAKSRKAWRISSDSASEAHWQHSFAKFRYSCDVVMTAPRSEHCQTQLSLVVTLSIDAYQGHDRARRFPSRDQIATDRWVLPNIDVPDLRAVITAPIRLSASAKSHPTLPLADSGPIGAVLIAVVYASGRKNAVPLAITPRPRVRCRPP